jgi:acetyltransferase-like isoleucine patch superfamily enzyme
MNQFPLLYKALRKVKRYLLSILHTPLARIKLFLNGAKVGNGLHVNGVLKVFVTRRGILIIGKNCRINSGQNYNISGGTQQNAFWVEGTLEIGEKVSMSSSAFFCKQSITIGNNVTIGGNTLIIDTDAHTLDPKQRGFANDRRNAKKKPVVIQNNVFIGARSTILKGVTIGENAIIGACSVVTKDIPTNEIWAGNPARFIKTIDSLK